jgi:hypothetical protein
MRTQDLEPEHRPFADPPEPPPPAMSPLKGFLVVLALMLAAAAVMTLRQPDLSPTKPSGGLSTPVSDSTKATAARPSRKKALAIFESLHRKSLQLGRQREISVIRRVFTPDGGAARRARRTLNRLQSDRVIDLSRFKTVHLSLRSVSAKEIQVEQVRRIWPCYRSEAGDEVTANPALVQQRIFWTLKLVARTWLIDKGRLEHAIVLRRSHGC